MLDGLHLLVDLVLARLGLSIEIKAFLLLQVDIQENLFEFTAIIVIFGVDLRVLALVLIASGQQLYANDFLLFHLGLVIRNLAPS